MKREWWDYPATMKYHRRPRIERVEILPPQQPHVRVDIVHHYRSGIRAWIMAAAIVGVAILIIRSPGAMLLAAILIGWKVPLAAAVLVLTLAIAAHREHRHGRLF